VVDMSFRFEFLENIVFNGYPFNFEIVVKEREKGQSTVGSKYKWHHLSASAYNASPC